jgi:hypothetical protein
VTLPSLLILGTDTVLAASPATPVQLAHACLAAGFHAVIPASWGDELIAARALDHFARAKAPVVQCSCPLVSSRLAAHGDTIAPMIFESVAPPVAAALYLRALHAPSPVQITFAGACSAGSDESIDVWLPAQDLLAARASRGIRLAGQPTEFDSVLPPDRRRHWSEPGGIPSRAALQSVNGSAELVELRSHDFAVDLAQHLLSYTRSFIDVATALGCPCSGAADVPAEGARARVREHEPPRSPSPVVDHGVPVRLESTVAVRDVVLAPLKNPETPAPPLVRIPVGAEPEHDEAVVITSDVSRRRSPSGPSRAVLGAMPQSRSSGRQLPRAYVARRRSSPRGMRQFAVRRQLWIPQRGPLSRWWWIGGIGVAIGIGLAWLVRSL